MSSITRDDGGHLTINIMQKVSQVLGESNVADAEQQAD